MGKGVQDTEGKVKTFFEKNQSFSSKGAFWTRTPPQQGKMQPPRLEKRRGDKGGERSPQIARRERIVRDGRSR